MEEFNTKPAADSNADEVNSLNKSIDFPSLTSDDNSVADSIISNGSNSFSNPLSKAVEDYKQAKLMTTDNPAQLGDLEREIDAQFKMLESTERQHQQSIVEKYLDLGMFGESYEKACGKKSIYTSNIRKKFGAKKLQIMQQARRMAARAEICKAYSFLNKNQLLALLSHLKDEGSAELIKSIPLSETDNPELVKEQADAKITLWRLNNKGINFVNFDQALLIVGIKGHALEVNQVKKLAAKLNDANIDKVDYVENWILNGCVFRNGEASEKPSGISQIINQVNNITTKFDLDDTAILNGVKAEDILTAYKAICALAQKLNLDLTESTKAPNVLMAA